MPINNENFSGMFFVKDSNGNWIPVGKISDEGNWGKWPDKLPFSKNVTLTGDMMVTGEINLSDESAAQWWAIAEGGIEIVER